MDAEEREMLRASLGRLVAERAGSEVIGALLEFGWFDLLAAEPAEAVPAWFEVQGENLVASPALASVMGSVASKSAEGDPPQTLLLPGPGAGAVPTSLVRGATVEIHGYGLAGSPTAGSVVIAARRGAELVLGRADPGDLTVTSIEGIDPWLGIVRLEGSVEMVPFLDGPAATAAWDGAVVAGRRALAHELIGVCRAMLGLAVGHAGERRQFGRPIGTFQAVQHRLAEAQVALTAAEAAATEAWAGPEAISSLLAKLWAGRAARLVGKQAQQTLGGMGFTWEHPFHRYFRRALGLDSLLGSAPELTVELGRQLIATRKIPALASL